MKSEWYISLDDDQTVLSGDCDLTAATQPLNVGVQSRFFSVARVGTLLQLVLTRWSEQYQDHRLLGYTIMGIAGSYHFM